MSDDQINWRANAVATEERPVATYTSAKVGTNKPGIRCMRPGCRCKHRNIGSCTCKGHIHQAFTRGG